MKKRYTKTRRRGQTLTAKEGRTPFDNEERRAKRLLSQKKASFISVFRKVNSIIANREVDTRFAGTGWMHNSSIQGNTPPAWTDGETIWLNPANFDSAFKQAIEEGNTLKVGETLARYKGLNYHELAHVLFTPRHTQKPSPQIRQAGEQMKADGDIGNSDYMWQCYNALEDQRIETMFVAKWTKAVPYFVRAVTDFILHKVDSGRDSYQDMYDINKSDRKKALALTYLLLHGRKYLPQNLRDQYRKLFRDEFQETDLIYVESIIDDYRTLVFPEDADKAVELVAKLAVWLNQWAEHSSLGMDQLVGEVTGGHEHQRESKPEAPSAQRKIRDKVEEKASEFAPASSLDEDEDDDTNPEEGGGTGEATDDSPESDSGDKEETESSVGGGTSGTPSDASPTHTNKELEDIQDELAKVAEALASSVSSEIQHDVVDTLKSMNEAESYLRDTETSRKYKARYTQLPKPNTVSSKNQLTKALIQLRHDAEPSWARKQDTGRVNIPAFMSSRGVDLDIFDQWRDEGEDATSIEVVILLDQSASMSGDIREASEALWMIKSACDVIDIDCSVIGYSDEHSVLYDGQTPAGKEVNMFPSIGATNPHGALEEAHKIFESSEKRHKLLFSLTDGQWFDSDIAIKQVKELINMGVKTDLIWICPAWKARETNPFEYELSYLRDNHNLGHQTTCVTAGVHNVVSHIKRNLTKVAQEAVAHDV